MVGTSTSPMQFSPNVSLTRGMIVTILDRMAGSPDVAGLADSFSDVPAGQWYADAVKWAAAEGIVAGYGDGRFGPNDPLTKEQLAALIHRTQQSSGKIPANDPTGSKTYTDLDKVSDWAKNVVTTLNAQGIFKDIPGSSFNPQEPATRAEVASMLYRYITAVER
jgi:hypothetical protein